MFFLSLLSLILLLSLLRHFIENPEKISTQDLFYFGVIDPAPDYFFSYG